MTESQDFERQFAQRLRLYAAPAARPPQREAVARAVAQGSEARRGLRARLSWIPLQLLPYAAVAALGLLVVVLAFGVWTNGVIGPGAPSPSPTRSPTPTPTTSPTPSPRPVPASVALTPGTYRYDSSEFTPVGFTFTVQDGWTAQNGGWNIIKNIDEPGELGFASSILTSINADACAQQTALVDVGATVDELVNALVAQSGPLVTGPSDVTLGGYSGQRLEVMAKPGADLGNCNVPGALRLWEDEARHFFVVGANQQSSIYVLDVGGERVVLTTLQNDASSAADVAELSAIIDSIRFQP